VPGACPPHPDGTTADHLAAYGQAYVHALDLMPLVAAGVAFAGVAVVVGLIRTR
jgi:hypothetical protein